MDSLLGYHARVCVAKVSPDKTDAVRTVTDANTIQKGQTLGPLEDRMKRRTFQAEKIVRVCYVCGGEEELG